MAKTKKKLSEISQHKRIEQTKKRLNPFEVHINKDKQNVLGKKSKADRGLPGVSRAKAINKRKRTLLHEYKLKNKDNLFLDKRIGEKNASMNEEDKALARFAAERMKAHKKKNIYSLNDEEVLTHRGQTLEEIEKFDDPKSDDEYSDDENKTGKLDNKFVGEAHFGGGMLSKSDTGKSRKDLIAELIAESKKRKAEKQKIREQTIDLTEKLDSEWRDLLPLVSAANKSIQETAEKTKADDYDIAVRELKFEAKGTPTDKLKSEEEIVKEEKEKLEALEADRLARMKGLINNSNNEIKHKSADDLDDGFAVEAINDEVLTNEKSSVKEDQENSNNADDSSDNSSNDNDDSMEEEEEVEKDKEKEDEEDEEEVEEEEKEKIDSDEVDNADNEGNEELDTVKMNGSIKEKRKTENSTEDEFEEDTDKEDSDDDNLSDLKESESSSEDEDKLDKQNYKSITKKKLNSDTDVLQLGSKNRQEDIRTDLMKRKQIMENARKELPYTYKVPETYEELQGLLQNHNADYQSIIVERIIKCNHWSLNNTNKEKLTTLFLFLLQHLNDYAVEDDVESVKKCFDIFDRLSPFLYDLAHLNAQNARSVIQEIIKEKHEAFEKNKRKYPGLDTLIFFKLVSLIFPTSDFRHPIVTPCLIFMSQILLRCRVKSKVDISKGLFISTLILEYTVLSKRFAPSVINFLRGIIYVATPKHLIQGVKVIPPFKTVGESSNLLILNEDQTHLDIKPGGALMNVSDLVDGPLDDEFRIRVLSTTMNLLCEFKDHLGELEAAYPIFEPIIKLLKLNTFNEYPENMRKHIKQLRKGLKELKNKKLEHIVIEKKKPKPLRLYEPRIEVVYDGKKHKTMSKEKAEREKLLHKYKKEMKGAMREIRRDRTFLTKVQIKQQIKNDEERKRKVREIFGEAAMQQSELKKLKRQK